MSFKPVTSQVDFPALEKDILKWWYESGVVDKYLHKNDNSPKKFSFLDGPITANNPMGVQHGQGRALKDLFQRYKNVRGFKQRFQNGFDCQGLWLEVQEEKDLGLNSKRDIEKYGIEKFCIGCRKRVEKFSKIQTEQSKRLGMFMDWANSYYTMSETNNLYIWYFLKKCHEKGWLYEGVDSMPWCPRCGTAISQHELSDDGYKIVEHMSVYVKFKLKDDPHISLLIWTTTPWTLAVNVAVAVNPQKDYVKVKLADEFIILAENRLDIVTGNYVIIERFKGKRLQGMEYSGPFDELPAASGIKHMVIEWKEVSDAEGSGLVHIAPGAGEEDFQLGKQFELRVLAPLDEFGIYSQGYGFLSGKFALEVKEEVFASLKEKGLFYKQEPITHSYPHCWRCKQELVFRTTSEWFISANEIRPLMKKAAKKANWLPPSAEKRMQDWLNNMGDWPISRRRYWGLALPFYKCGNNHVTVVGSKEELRELAVDPGLVDKLPELHRPWIDDIKIKCPQCGQEAARTKEVGDCWLDAGIVPFSTLKYLEDNKYWQEWFPTEFITEYVGQIKLWFYSTLFMSVALENTPPWKNVLATGYIVDEKGEPMHKTKGNYIPFDDAADKMGVDVMRWIYLSNNPFDNIKFGYKMGDDVRRRFILMLWNIYSFFVTYANIDGFKPSNFKASSNILDQWILARLNQTISIVTKSLDKYDAYSASHAIEDFVNDLSLWYVRRSRDRVGPSAVDQKGKSICLSTLHLVLSTLSKLLAPFTPYLSEEIYRNLTGEESVHLSDWPKSGKSNLELIAQMQTVRKIVEMGLSQRKSAGVKVRQPLRSITIHGQELDDELQKLIKDELNIKNIIINASDELSVELDLKLDDSLIAEGQTRELIRQIQDKRKELGARLDQKINLVLPTTPSNLDDLKRHTLADIIETGTELKVELI